MQKVKFKIQVQKKLKIPCRNKKSGNVSLLRKLNVNIFLPINEILRSQSGVLAKLGLLKQGMPEE